LVSQFKTMCLVAFTFCVVVVFNACEGPGTVDSNSAVSGSSFSLDCPLASDELRNPTEYDEMIQLINALPKPLSLECFIANFDPPMNLMAVNSVASAQPAEGIERPRILIVRDQFVITVVPSASENPLAEFSRVVSSGVSIKGELEFPITGPLVDSAAFDGIRSTFNGESGTTCRFCHRNEVEQGDGSVASEIVDPNPFQAVGVESMQSVLNECDVEATPNKCRILKAVYGRGEVNDINWPF